MSWVNFPDVSVDYTTYPLQLDILLPLMGLMIPRPFVRYISELTWITNPYYECNTPVVFKTCTERNLEINQECLWGNP